MEALRARAKLLASIRGFFSERAVLEVEVPVLGLTTATDLHIDSIAVQASGFTGYLQTSPEFFMKRLLAAGSGAIYSLGKVFRAGESGTRHNPEFTMLEWYRPGWNELQLMAEVADLVNMALAEPVPVTSLDYGASFERCTGLNPHLDALEQLQKLSRELSGSNFAAEGRSTCLDLVFSLAVEPTLPAGLVFVKNYPACQSALARTEKTADGVLVARRFEVFLNGMELANGYFELTDHVEQRSRFLADNALRCASGKEVVPVDEELLSALAEGMPSCAGVALGVDRLLMQKLAISDIAETLAFSQRGEP